MGVTSEKDIPRLQLKAKRAARAGVLFLFLFAFFWSVDPFFVWLFLGATSYCLFLAWHYWLQTKPQTGGDESQPSLTPKALSAKTNKWTVVITIVFFGMVMWVAVMVLSDSSSSDTEGTPLREQGVNQEGQSILYPGNYIDSMTNLGNELYHQGEYDNALEYYDKVLSRDPGNQYALYDKALVYYSKKDYERSKPLLQFVIRKFPNYGDALWLLGDVHLDRNQLDSAKICFDRAYQTGLRTGTFLQLMASLYENDNRSRAISLYRESITQDSTLVESYRKLSILDPSRSDEYAKRVKRLETQ